jgi:hypothetical protein
MGDEEVDEHGCDVAKLMGLWTIVSDLKAAMRKPVSMQSSTATN